MEEASASVRGKEEVMKAKGSEEQRRREREYH